jgi:hypothetical protein
MNVKCPSGLQGEVRKLKGAEANILADRKAAQKGEVYDRILSACWVKTTNAGPYSFVEEGDKAPPWGKILVCDRFYALVAIRIATYGADYAFPVQCPATPCRTKFDWEINLERDLEVYDLPEESVEKVASGSAVFETSVGGELVRFKLMTGEDERRAGRIITKNRDQLMTTALSSRIVEVGDLSRTTEIDKFLKELDLDLQWDLLRAFEEVDGGVEQVIEIECPECSLQFEVTLPFEGEGFWIPSTRKQAKSRRSTTKTARTFGGTTPEDSDR